MSTERIELGQVTAPSGNLFLVDCGLLPLWCHDRTPVMPDSVFEVCRDLDAHGTLAQIRIELATDERLDLTRRM